MSEIDPRLESRIASLRALPVPRAAALARIREDLEDDVARPRVTVSPLAAASALIATACLTSLVWIAALADTGDSAVATRVPVQFVVLAGDAHTVSLVGDFNDWNPGATPMEPTAGGTWSIVVQLEPGPVTYSFLVDGVEWRADPSAAAVRSDFGRPSSIAFVNAPEVET